MLWLVTPVFGRVALTRLCFEQRARMLDELATLGVEARQLVVGSDANLDTAQEFGFETLRAPNVLGLRVNNGFEWACREGGATHVAYCGSDDWHLADYFAQAPAPGHALTCQWQGFVPPDGLRLVVMRNQSPYGGAPWIISADLLAPSGYRPADDTAPHGVDGSVADGLIFGVTAPIKDWDERRRARKRVFQFDTEADLLRMVDFKGGGEQVTPFKAVVGVKRPRMFESREPFTELARVYPVDLVERMEKFYAERRAQ